MGILKVLFLLEILLLPPSLLCDPKALKKSLDHSPFPSNFLFGTASSSYQVIFQTAINAFFREYYAHLSLQDTYVGLTLTDTHDMNYTSAV